MRAALLWLKTRGWLLRGCGPLSTVDDVVVGFAICIKNNNKLFGAAKIFITPPATDISL